MGFVGNALNSVVGGLTGSNKAADAQTNAANQANATALEIFNKQTATMKPFVDSGQSFIPAFTSLMNNRAGTLNDYYNSAEYQGLANQARYQGLAAGEATGGLGSTAMGNQLSSIAPQLGQSFLNDRYNQLLGGLNVGLAGAGATNAAAGNYSNTYGNNMQQIGASQAGKAQSGFNSLMQIGGVASGFF